MPLFDIVKQKVLKKEGFFEKRKRIVLQLYLKILQDTELVTCI
jgi:hypothetical protein